jgi:putative peptidoglycan lipid II flippase
MANTLPTLLFTLLSGGVLSAIFIPQITRYLQNKEKGENDINKLLTFAGVLLLSLTLILTMCTPLFINLMASSLWTDSQRDLAISFGIICMPQVFFYSMYSLLGQVLMAKERFFAYMWAPIANNVVSCIGLTIFVLIYGSAPHENLAIPGSVNDLTSWGAGKVSLIAVTATLGIVMQAVILVFALIKAGFSFKLIFSTRGIGLKRISSIAGWSFMMLLLNQIITILVVNVASSAPTEAGTVIDVAGNAAYTQTLMVLMLPYSLISLSIVTAIYPKIVSAVQKRNQHQITKHFSYAIRITGVWNMFFSFVFLTLSAPIIKLLIFTITPEALESMSAILFVFSFRLIPMTFVLIIERTFLAFENAKTYFFCSLPCAVLQILIIFIAKATLPPSNWVAAIALSFVISNVLEAVLVFITLRMHLKNRDTWRIATLYFRLFIAGFASMIAGTFVRLMLFSVPSTISWVTALTACILIGLIMLIVYVAMLKLLKVHELRIFTRPVWKVLRRVMKR